MEKIAHIWNVNQFMTQLNCPQSKNLQTFYLRCCKKISKGCGLPKQKFGPNAMCMHCNSLWNTVDHRIRISSGRTVSKSLKKIVRSLNCKDKKVPRVRATLGRKVLKNKKNRLFITCLVCSRITKIALAKPERQKVKEEVKAEPIIIPKGKKKKGKDKTAGLIIPQPIRVKAESTEVSDLKDERPRGSSCSTIKSCQRLKRLNINRLKDAVKQGVTPSKSKTLHSFLSEL